MSECKLPKSVSLLTRESVKHKVELHTLIANGGANSIEHAWTRSGYLLKEFEV